MKVETFRLKIAMYESSPILILPIITKHMYTVITNGYFGACVFPLHICYRHFSDCYVGASMLLRHMLI